MTFSPLLYTVTLFGTCDCCESTYIVLCFAVPPESVTAKLTFVFACRSLVKVVATHKANVQ